MSQIHYGLSAETQRELEKIAKAHGYTLAYLRGGSKAKSECEARRECYVFLHRVRRWSTPQIGALFGRDHTTIVWALAEGERAAAKRARLRERYHRTKQVLA